MATQTLAISFLCFLHLLLLTQGGASHHHHHHHHHCRNQRLHQFRPTKLFVFGDSYADTGNNKKSDTSSWKLPYGITFPGKPTGRFSDGRVLTDFVAKFVGVKSPIPYKWRKLGAQHLKYGVNLAHGGTGVFDTFVTEPNMTTQIDYFDQLINESVYTAADIETSVALVTLAGNDYSAYIVRNGNTQGLESFIGQVVNQLTVNLRRIHGLGVKKVVVSGLQPLGCLPANTAVNSFKQCNETLNALVGYHNLLLQQAVTKLNNDTKDFGFVVLDLYSSFMSVLRNNGTHQGTTRFENALKPCCVGISNGYSCGSVDESSGAKMYTVCRARTAAFFWDTVHPTQEGWRAVYSSLQSNLHQIY